MANSKNTLLIVSCVLWKATNEGIPNVTYCDSRAFRSEENAQDRYKALIKSFKENGYKLRKIVSTDGKEYFGYRLRNDHGGQGVVYIDRNPVYTPY